MTTPTPTIDRESVELTMAEAKRFMEDYYKAFDANRAGLVDLYREDSVLKCDRREIKGKEAIVAELASSLQQRRRRVDRIGLIPSGVPGGALAMVSGYVWPDGGEQDARLFCHVSLSVDEGSVYTF